MPAVLQDQVARFLQRKADQLKSRMLSALAVRVSADPLSKARQSWAASGEVGRPSAVGWEERLKACCDVIGVSSRPHGFTVLGPYARDTRCKWSLKTVWGALAHAGQNDDRAVDGEVDPAGLVEK